MKKWFYRIATIVLFTSILLITYSVYEIYSSKNKVNQNLEVWNDNNIIKDNTNHTFTEKSPKVRNYDKTGKFEILGKLTIVKTKNVFPIIQGTTDEDLKNGAGHYLESVLPGKSGNCIIFGHRDGVFKKLEDVKVGDTILVETNLGKFIYKITNLKITSLKESEIIKYYKEPMLTLVTCYPFNYIGSAPKRFLVTGKLQM